MNFAIVAGHGGSDRGAFYPPLIEKTINLLVAELVVDKINAQISGAKATLIRTQDEDMSLYARGQASNEADADFVICVHVNAIENVDELRGRMTFYWPGNSDGKGLAQRLTNGSLHTRPVWPVSATGWRSRAFNVIKYHKATAVVFEMGFATNVNDRDYLLSAIGQDELAQVVTDACAGCP